MPNFTFFGDINACYSCSKFCVAHNKDKKRQLNGYSDVNVIAEARNLEEGLEILGDPENKPDVAFLDINLPDGLVFELLEKLRPVDFEIIFTTGHREHAQKACEFSSIGFIEKPIDEDELKKSLLRVRSNPPNTINQRLDIFKNVYHNRNNPNAFGKFSVSGVDSIYFVNLTDILRLEAEDNYTYIFLKNGEKITASKTIKSYEELLVPVNFYRVHKSHIINLNFIRKFVKGDGGYIIMEDGAKITVSRRRRSAFLEKLKELNYSF